MRKRRSTFLRTPKSDGTTNKHRYTKTGYFGRRQTWLALAMTPVLAAGIAVSGFMLPANATDDDLTTPATSPSSSSTDATTQSASTDAVTPSYTATPSDTPSTEPSTSPSTAPSTEPSDTSSIAPDTGDSNTGAPDAAKSTNTPDKTLTGPEVQADTGGVTTLATSTTPVCTAGYVYGISSGGQIQQVASNGTVTDLGNDPSSGSDFNGLGIGYDGSPVYSYLRSNDVHTAAIWKYNPATGNWTDTHLSVNSETNSRTVQFVGGAVNLSPTTPLYMFGGFNSDGTVFRIWQYNGTTITYLGSISTSQGAGGATNGDMAFDSQGNLFVVRGSGSTTTVFSITAAALASASGGTINSSYSTGFTTNTDVNGVAFDSSGKGYLGTGSSVRSYNMPNWSNSHTVVSSGFSSTDLASCSSPATVTLQKIVNSRVVASDQFKLNLLQSSTTLGTATTSGSATGVQDQQVGPLPVTRGVTLSFNETFTNSNPGSYTTTFTCTVDGAAMSPPVSGSGASGSVTIPQTGQAVLCQFTNTPKTNTVTLTKTWLGGAPTDTAGLSINGSTVTAASTSTANGTNPQVDTVQKATASAAYGSIVTLGEVIRGSAYTSVYACKQGTTDITVSGTTFTMPTTVGAVTCVVTNTPKTPTSLTLNKAFDIHYGAPATPSAWDLTAAKGGTTTHFVHGVTQNVVAGTYTIDEVQQAGYQLKSLSCSVNGGSPVVVPITGANAKQFAVPVNKATACTLTNSDLPGSIVWNKGNVKGDSLAGSVWKLVGPTGTGSQTVTVEDNVGQPGYTGPDTNPNPGAFKLVNLTWGSYTVTETAAPVGYVLSNPAFSFPVVIKGTALDYTHDGTIVNVQQTALMLPLTGGVGTDAFLIAGLLVLLLAAALAIWQRRRTVKAGR